MKSIKSLKRQPRMGGVPTRGEIQITNITPIANATVPLAEVQALAEQMAAQMLAEQQAQSQLATNGRVYTKFDVNNDIVSKQTEVVTAGMWSDDIASLTTYATASGQTNAQRRYYVDIYQENPANEGAAVQFALAYGHALGSGSDSQG
jgi:hypothetical protein